MELPVNHFKHALKAGKPQIGIWSSLCSHIVADILANSGFDWVLLDTEHSPNELPMVQQQLHAMQGGTAVPEHRAVIVENGGGLRSYDVGDRPILDGYAESELAGGGRGQVLFPWPNRLDGGRWDDAGSSRQLPLSEPAHGNAIHAIAPASVSNAPVALHKSSALRFAAQQSYRALPMRERCCR